ncbi:CBS domain-containing protein [Nocardiopsis potens]|uniref:CBS domain-containing protein n=1 Tax=Nocardiopsis potens TaxID=1246458 RepID=UPI00035DA1EB|nr:CBS domain-containing protein [Nocardiopsis potens]
MSTRVIAASEDAGFKEIAVVLRNNGVSALPVVDADRKVVGVVSAADLLRRIEAPGTVEGSGSGASARDLMTTPAVTVTADATPVEAAERMRRRRVKRLPVVDGRGRLVGLVSRSDLLRVFFVRDDRIRWLVAEDVVRRGFGLPGVAVSVEGGVVTLEGEVPRRSDIPRLLHDAGRVEGVVGVRSRLAYRKDDLAPPAARERAGRGAPPGPLR